MVGHDYSAQCLSRAAPEYAGPPRRGDHFPLPDIALHERGSPAQQYRHQLAAQAGEPPGP